MFIIHSKTYHFSYKKPEPAKLPPRKDILLLNRNVRWSGAINGYFISLNDESDKHAVLSQLEGCNYSITHQFPESYACFSGLFEKVRHERTEIPILHHERRSTSFFPSLSDTLSFQTPPSRSCLADVDCRPTAMVGEDEFFGPCFSRRLPRSLLARKAR